MISRFLCYRLRCRMIYGSRLWSGFTLPTSAGDMQYSAIPSRPRKFMTRSVATNPAFNSTWKARVLWNRKPSRTVGRSLTTRIRLGTVSRTGSTDSRNAVPDYKKNTFRVIWLTIWHTELSQSIRLEALRVASHHLWWWLVSEINGNPYGFMRHISNACDSLLGYFDFRFDGIRVNWPLKAWWIFNFQAWDGALKTILAPFRCIRVFKVTCFHSVVVGVEPKVPSGIFPLGFWIGL